MTTIEHWVDGTSYHGTPVGTIPVENPGTGAVEAELLMASDDDLNHVVEVARKAQKEWAKVPLAKRVAIMFKMRELVLEHQDEMARLIVAEHGKNYSDAIGEIQRGRETLDFATAINVALKGEHSYDIASGVDIHTLHQPVGVVAGQSVDITGNEIEYLVLPLHGGCDINIPGENTTYTLTGRESVFTDITDYAYIPRNTNITITSSKGARLALPGAKATADLPPRYCPREDVDTTLRGSGPASRQVNNYALGNPVETSHLLACEVLTPGGNWSSYPPHKHDEHTDVERILEEIYYYEISPGCDGIHEGFALQRIYPSPGHDIDVCTEVHSGDIVIMPYGYHGPSVAAPGYDLYYLNVMAGPAEDSTWLMTDDPHHTWVRSTWDEDAIDPRLPMTPMNPPRN